MFEKFTERARKVMSLSRQEAQRLNQISIGTEAILLGIVSEGGGVATKVLKNLNVDLNRIRQEIEKLVQPDSMSSQLLGQLPFSPRAKRVIELSGEVASQLGHEVIGTEHILLGLLKENEGIAAQVLINLGLKLEETQHMIMEVLGADVDPKKPVPAATEPDKTSEKDRFLLEMLKDDRQSLGKVIKDQQSNLDKLIELYRQQQAQKTPASALSSEDKAKMIVSAWLARGGQEYIPSNTEYLTNMIAFAIEASRRGA